MIILAALAVLATLADTTVQEASADDCAIVVEIGKSQAAWGPNGPNQPFFIEGQQKDGSTYRQQCPWNALGVGAPTPATPGNGFAIDKPVYGDDGATAEADVNFVAWAGPGTAPFISVRHCELRKRKGQWRLKKCVQGPII